MKIKKIGILSDKQVERRTAINTIKEYGKQCSSSDLSIIMGNQTDNQGYGSYYITSNEPTNPKKVEIKYVTPEGKISTIYNAKASPIGVRICISFDDIEDFNFNDINLEYPLTAISGMVGKTIDKLFEKKSQLIIKTGRKHDIDGTLYDEYEVFGIKFIKKENNYSSKILSDGTVTEKYKDVYLKVDKIPFIIDEDARIMYSSYSLYTVNFLDKEKNYTTNDLIKELNNNFLKSINDELKHEEPCLLFDNKEKTKQNRYNFDFSNLTEEEIIEICLNSNIAVFLHGKTGTGKTERMLTLDKDLELIDFGCTSSDGFTGIVAKDFNSKELFLYEPYWYKNLCKKCKEEPNKLHILFLEELTNAKNDIQKVAFEVTLNKTLTNSGFRLELPENAVVCAAGNEASESRSANTM